MQVAYSRLLERRETCGAGCQTNLGGYQHRTQVQCLALIVEICGFSTALILR